MAEPVIVRQLLFESTSCCVCGVPIVTTGSHMNQLRRDKTQFYCINGHSQSFTLTEAARLKTQLDNERRLNGSLQAKVALLEGVNKSLKRSRSVYRGRLKATKERIANGVCPCCKRSFENLRRHMATKHPHYCQQEPERVK